MDLSLGALHLLEGHLVLAITVNGEGAPGSPSAGVLPEAGPALPAGNPLCLLQYWLCLRRYCRHPRSLAPSPRSAPRPLGTRCGRGPVAAGPQACHAAAAAGRGSPPPPAVGAGAERRVRSPEEGLTRRSLPVGAGAEGRPGPSRLPSPHRGAAAKLPPAGVPGRGGSPAAPQATASPSAAGQAAARGLGARSCGGAAPAGADGRQQPVGSGDGAGAPPPRLYKVAPRDVLRRLVRSAGGGAGRFGSGAPRCRDGQHRGQRGFRVGLHGPAPRRPPQGDSG